MDKRTITREQWLRRKLLNWHYHKVRTLSVFNLLEAGYQKFRNDVSNRLGANVDFREAIKKANLKELEYLQWFRDEEWAEQTLKRSKYA